MKGPLLLVGCGKMGGALLQGWLERDIIDRGAIVIEPNEDAVEPFALQSGITILGRPDDIPTETKPAVVVLAIKPQMMDDAIGSYRRFAKPGTLFLSIAAGKTIAYFERHLGAEAAIVRSMPNTPAAVGRGITVWSANARVDDEQRRLTQLLLEAVGEVAVVNDETLLDAVTAVSGGGPAYVFLLIECLAEAGAKAGLPADLAMRLARATISGAGELARLSSEPAAQLRQNVTSPKGTTFEALKILMAEDGIQPLFTRAIAAATQRSRELAS
ncbi:MAG: pyrroline-5-carboxylate reductase [Alphaproteobacteria bacterium]|nr:pyrroline-5-carboxylate reductase [Alphaproteobacteria bacterium]